MKKAALIFGIVLLVGLLVIPSATNPSLTETEHTYKPRNARGIHSFGTYLDGAGRINLTNGNLTYGRQIVSRPGRAGFDLDLSIYFNTSAIEADQSLPSFAAPAVMPFNERQLDSITISLPDQELTQEYGYGYIGELTTVKNRITLGEFDAVSDLADFEYGTLSFSDTVYREVEERAVISKTEYGSDGQPFIWTIDYLSNGNATNPSKTTVSDARGVTEYRFNYSSYPARSWKDGLLSSMERVTTGILRLLRMLMARR